MWMCTNKTYSNHFQTTRIVCFEAANKLDKCYQVNRIVIIEWVKVEIQSVQLKRRHFIIVCCWCPYKLIRFVFHVIRFTSMIMMFNMFAFAVRIKKIFARIRSMVVWMHESKCAFHERWSFFVHRIWLDKISFGRKRSFFVVSCFCGTFSNIVTNSRRQKLNLLT